ncbi:MAG: nucleotide pyrophosphohydrolase [Promethearchaeota archaeon]
MPNSYSLNEYQKKINLWIKDYGGYWPPLSMLAAIIEEIGEVAREINNLEGYKPLKSEEQVDIGGELADLLFSLLCLANHYKIDLDKKLVETLLKYTNRDGNRFL